MKPAASGMLQLLGTASTLPSCTTTCSETGNWTEEVSASNGATAGQAKEVRTKAAGAARSEGPFPNGHCAKPSDLANDRMPQHCARRVHKF